ncbi:receptor-like protein 51 [Miscanthus floridulus]|uniref:receptor-like protein 51 n=1 Tax=Miscanthus floridulus TaxID=154761 RepID=UPI0034598ACB
MPPLVPTIPSRRALPIHQSARIRRWRAAPAPCPWRARFTQRRSSSLLAALKKARSLSRVPTHARSRSLRQSPLCVPALRPRTGMDAAALFLSRLLPLLVAAAIAGAAPLDPQQLLALRALGLGAVNASYDAGAPFRRVTSLALTNCSDTTSVSAAALEALAPSLRTLAFSDCPAAPPRALPPEQLASGLQAFSCTASLHRLSAVWLSHLTNLTELTVADTPLATGSPTELAVVVSHMECLTRLTISNANLSGFLPHHWHCPNLTHLDLSGNRITGAIPDTLTLLAGITHINLSSNVLNGPIPTSIGDLISLTTLDLSNNTISGGIPDTLSTLPELEVLNLGSNRLNGSIPLFLAEMRGLRELNLENNDFDGMVPFTAKFLSRLRVFRSAGNGKLCYNRSVLFAEIAVGVAPCDKYGFPVLPPPATARSERSADYDDGGGDREADAGADTRGGPSATVLGVAIGLSCLAFLVILLVCICKVCR